MYNKNAIYILASVKSYGGTIVSPFFMLRFQACNFYTAGLEIYVF